MRRNWMCKYCVLRENDCSVVYVEYLGSWWVVTAFEPALDRSVEFAQWVSQSAAPHT